MSGTPLENFDADWLALREPADHAARDRGLEEELLARLAGRGRLLVVDLGAGSGSTARHLAPRLAPLGAAQRWRLVDHDTALLARARSSAPAGVQLGTETADLADPARLREVLAGADVVVASALLDVLPATVATGLVAALDGLDTRPAVLFTLTVSGGAHLDPPEDGDDALARAFDDDQRRHGLGPDATGHVAAAFAAAGWRVRQAPSPWHLDAADSTARPLLHAWAQGWARAAGRPGALDTRLREPGLRAVVPHEDLLALPPG